MAPPISPAATPAATPRCACAGAGAAGVETANVGAAAMAINVLFMASPLSWKLGTGNPACRFPKFHISLECSMNRAALIIGSGPIASHHFGVRIAPFGSDHDIAAIDWW